MEIFCQDISPNFAGTVLGVTNCIGSIPGFVAPAVAAQIVKGDDSNTDKWDLVWMIAIIILAIESVFYIIFAAGTPQPWNFPEEAAGSQTKKGKRDLFGVSDIYFSTFFWTMDIIQILFTVGITLAGILYVIISVVIHAT